MQWLSWTKMQNLPESEVNLIAEHQRESKLKIQFEEYVPNTKPD